jgi:phosphoribosyl-AMP cyclohydrolase / phosphoribosyl-ATP pyrophosphohydrolase
VDGLKFDANGLVVAVCQDHVTGDIRMVAWMNAEALATTLRTNLATFYSRSRQRLWTKGETSGNTLQVLSMHVDCDGDTLLLRVAAAGPACHTGQPTCFFTRLSPAGEAVADSTPAAQFLAQLERELIARQESTAEKSYTKSLLSAGPGKIAEKIIEEAGEFTTAVSSESDERVVNEAADLLYHLMVGLRHRGLPVSRVLETLAARSNKSGHEEKAQRGKQQT